MKIENDIITGADVVKLGNGTVINRYSHVVAGAEIGDDCMVGEHVYVAGGAIIGNRVRIQNINSIWDGVVLEDDVFVAPSVVFTNHHNPHDRHDRKSVKFHADKTVVKYKATLCANSTIIAPKVIGENAVIGGGALVLVNVPASVLVTGKVCRNSWATLTDKDGNKIKGSLDYSGNFIPGVPEK